MKIAIIGTGYVGLVTGVCLSDIGHQVTCIDVDEAKVEMLNQGISPIYEPGLDELITKNLQRSRLSFTTNHREAFQDVEAIYIAVGTPQSDNGSCDLSYVVQAARDIAEHLQNDAIIITKSTVPVGTNMLVKDTILTHLQADVQIAVASNPEFLREGHAIHDMFHGDRIVIGTEDEQVAKKVASIYEPLKLPIFFTNIASAEMIKYAANAFLATKISFINEIANLCERVDANVVDVAKGMGLDSRIGEKFLQAGIGYGGSCFPKDTEALIHLADQAGYSFEILKSVTNVNHRQKLVLVEKAKQVLGGLNGKKIALLGLAFKPNTDDIREAASLQIIQELVALGSDVIAYDPIAMENVKKEVGQTITYASSAEEALAGADAAMLVTEWDEFKQLDLAQLPTLMETAILFDGRNVFEQEEAKRNNIQYYSIGR